MKKRVKSLRGVEVHTSKTGETTIFVRYMAEGKPRRECIGPSEVDAFGKDKTLAKARRVLKQRRAERAAARANGETWLSPKERERKIREAAAAREEGRSGLLFESARDAFVKECSARYARPSGVRELFDRLSLAFKGRMLDSITRADVRRYVTDRLENSGPFTGWARKVGLRPAQTEITMLSALYGFMSETFPELANPCSRPRGSRWAQTKSLAYRPARRKVIPSPEQVSALLAAAPDATHRAAWALCYFTGCRPESEACKVTHADVELPEPGKVRALRGEAPIVGRITFRKTKTGQDRTVPLHPIAAEALRSIMLPRPEEEAKCEAWEQTPVFRGVKGKPWSRFSYREGWHATLAAVLGEHPDLAGMVCRDLRSAFVTHLREAGLDATLAGRLAGHSATMSDHYLALTPQTAEKAVLALGVIRTSEAPVYDPGANAPSGAGA